MKNHLKQEWALARARITAAVGRAGFGSLVLNDLIGMALLCLMTALLCVGAKGALELYAGIALSSAVLFLAVSMAGRLLGSDGHFIYSAMVLIAVGIALQVLLFNSDQSGLKQVQSLVVYGLIGLAGGTALIMGFRAGMKLPRKSVYLLLGGGSVLIYLILLIAGISAGGTRAWLLIGSFSFQPTELCKLAALVATALLVTDKALTPQKRLLGVLLTLLLHTVFLVAVNELGTLLILVAVSLILCFIYLPNTKQLLAVVLILALIAGLLVAGCWVCHRLTQGNEKDFPAILELGARIFEKLTIRVSNLLDPAGADRYNEGYQVYQVRRTLSTAKLFGSCTEQNVPVIDSDFIFIYLISRFGIVAAIGVTLITVVMAFEGSIAVLRRPVSGETAASLSFVLCLAVGSFISALSSLCLLPTVGVGYAFLSRGGTAAAINYMMLLFILYGMRRPLALPRKKQLKRGEDT